jgi:hypothetical protein
MPDAKKEVNSLHQKVLQDPLLLRRLNDRVYEIFKDNLRQMRDRRYGGRS